MTAAERLPDSPMIEVWYGRHQSFGQRGHPQRWINILGRVHQPELVTSLSYCLNKEAKQTLRMGPNRRRLTSPGDFNIELDRSELAAGDNTVTIIARDRYNHETIERVAIQHIQGRTWPMPYTIEWQTVSSIQDAAQVVDGLWELDENSVRPVVPGYDRLLAIGDYSWTDYELTVPITIHDFDPTGFRYPSYGPGVGILLRWNGHYHWKREPSRHGWWPLRSVRRWLGHDDWTDRPRWGWWPFGALGWYRWQRGKGYRVHLIGNAAIPIAEEDSKRELRLGLPYVFKVGVHSRPGQTSLYRMKVWEQAAHEPTGWDLMGPGPRGELTQGSALLVAHHVDAQFGDVSVVRPG